MLHRNVEVSTAMAIHGHYYHPPVEVKNLLVLVFSIIVVTPRLVLVVLCSLLSDVVLSLSISIPPVVPPSLLISLSLSPSH